MGTYIFPQTTPQPLPPVSLDEGLEGSAEELWV